MKMIKKLFGSVVALAMAFALTTSVSAAKVTVETETGKTNLSGRTFTAYQIFKGTKSGDTPDEVLADVTWGDAITSAQAETTLINSLKNNFTDVDAVKKLKTTSEAKEVAKALDGFTDDQGIKLAKVIYDVLADNDAEDKKIPDNVDKTVLKPENGEYSALVQDGYYLIVDETTTGSVNPAVLQVVGDITIKPKTEDVDVTKEVEDKENGKSQGFGNSADYSIGDSITFRLSAQVPDMTHYDTYKFNFIDTLSNGLSFNDDIKVYSVSAKEVNGVLTYDEEGLVKTNLIGSNHYTLTDETLDNGGGSFSVNLPDLKTTPYGSSKRYITAGDFIVIEYTATLNSSAAFQENNKVKLEYSNNPNTGGDGETTEKTVYVYNFTLNGTKVDGALTTEKLEGAEFIITRNNNEYALVTNGKITMWTKWDGKKESLPKEGNIKSAKDGTFSIIGLDAGDYKLYEVVAPTGYNTPANPFEIKITADHDGSSVTDLTMTVDGTSGTGDTNTGVVTGNILNTKGTTLPETGGMGTTMLYVIGGVLLVGSAILLITKKRMSNEG
ncbi:isopeptide-forming domain-containing fimbrial protein [Dubosiella newyorkensis]|uniref:SpaA-like prealbumin fold domain-containing protein n=1 Tax=Dubosiella newyorkensis TaxID=1862672 RepID=A0A1U7NP72_9FIRM|nr:isopeptide-forming domain-containing fimbrial protein [Dubosiella newyorkensis]OLU47279.1 hypothetical protein BO225_03155 [Dubosiella newyorkensis]